MSKDGYKEAWPVKKALEAIAQESGTHFEPTLLGLFFKVRDKIVAHMKE